MARSSRGPWFRKSHNSWWATVGGKQVCLGTSEAVARQKWITIFSLPKDMRGDIAARMVGKTKSKAARARRDGKIIERAAVIYLAELLGFEAMHGNPRNELRAALLKLPTDRGALGLVRRLKDFPFLPDGWNVRLDGESVALTIIEIEYAAAMGLKKILAYAELAKDLMQLGGSIRVVVSDRYGTWADVDIVRLGEGVRKAAASLGREDPLDLLCA